MRVIYGLRVVILEEHNSSFIFFFSLNLCFVLRLCTIQVI